MKYHNIEIHKEQLDVFCRKNNIRRLSLFGSILREDFGPESDIDFLVEFEEGKTPSLLGMADLEIKISKMLKRKVDLRTPNDLSRYFRDEVLERAEPQYVCKA